jgi:hypothetical protein
MLKIALLWKATPSAGITPSGPAWFGKRIVSVQRLFRFCQANSPITKIKTRDGTKTYEAEIQ